jgi:hypothetical protein
MPLPLGEYLKRWDENIEKFGNDIGSLKKRRNIVAILNVALILYNTYEFFASNSPWRYLNGLAALLLAYLIYYLQSRYKSLQRSYDNYKELRKQAFSPVENI